MRREIVKMGNIGIIIKRIIYRMRGRRWKLGMGGRGISHRCRMGRISRKRMKRRRGSRVCIRMYRLRMSLLSKIRLDHRIMPNIYILSNKSNNIYF